MRVVVIGGKGHIGTYLVPRLVTSGYDVVSISRGNAEPYTPDGRWAWVEQVCMDRVEEEKTGNFGAKIAGLKPDVVVDLISFEVSSTEHIVEALRGRVAQYLYCGSIWAHGAATVVPAAESLPRHPICEYGQKKYQSEAFLIGEANSSGFPATVVMPGHITGTGWNCINPAGNFDPLIFQRIARGEEIPIPHFGMETLHHVHADDVAQVFLKSIQNRARAIGESFHAVAPAAMTLRGLAETVASWYGREAVIRYLPWKEWCAVVGRQDYINSTYSHIAHSDNYSIEKAKTLLGYTPRYTIAEAVRECVDSMFARGVITMQ